MDNDPQGNPVKAIFDPNSGITKNLIATNPNIPSPDTKHDPLHGHIDLDQQGVEQFRREPGTPR